MLEYDLDQVLWFLVDVFRVGLVEVLCKVEGMVFVFVGFFVMGFCGGEFDEEFRYFVYLSAFYIDEIEVINVMYN